MLNQPSSDAGTRLRRSKSASTVHRHQPSALEPLDPRVAQQHAVVAATTAFARAHGQAAAERSKKRSSELSRTKSASSRKSFTSEGSHFPPRESSIRSVNRPKASQPFSEQQQSRALPVTLEKFPSFYPTPGSDRPLSVQQSIAFNENIRPGSQPKSHRPSVASSITSQQIRKARSMYYASSVQTGSPIARPPAKYLTTPPPSSVSPAPGALPAILPARNTVPSPLASPQIPMTVESGETINNARDKYLLGFQQQHRQVKHRPSLFLVPFKKRQDRANVKERPLSAGFLSVSSKSRQTPVAPTMESLDDFGMPKQKKEKRTFSNSIKDKLKKVFRRTSNNKPTMPVQQIETSKDYFSYQVPPAALSSKTLDVPSPDKETLLRVRSRGSSLERMPSPLARPESRSSTRSRGSNRSLHSETNATHMSSRVTSWSDSSAGNTLTQRDIKRLTVIHESKDSISSDAERSISSISLRRKTVPLPMFTTFKDPMPMGSLMEETSTPVDPKRVFSALMKEIDATKGRNPESGPADGSPGAESDVFESSATKELHAIASRELHSSASREYRASTSSDQRPLSRRRPKTAQSKTNSIRSLGRVLKSTIRAVTPIEHQPPPIPVRKEARDTPSAEFSASSHSISPEHSVTLTSNIQQKHPRSQSTSEDLYTPKTVTPSAEQLEQRMVRSKERWKTPLDEHQHHGPLHHRSHARILSASQYAEVALHTPTTVVGIPALPELEGDSPKETTPTDLRTTPVNPMSRSPRPDPVFSPLSPSIYSRNTDGISILPNDSVMSFDGTNDDRQIQDETGSAMIITSRAVKSYVIGTPSPGNKTDSIRSSKDWKAWLSREVSELGSSLDGDIMKQGYTPIIRNESPASRHHRELTQIEDDRTTILARASTDTRVPSPSAPPSTQAEHVKTDPQQPMVPQNEPLSDAKAALNEDTQPALETISQKRAMSPVVRSPAVRKDRHSSAHSHRSAQSRSSISTSKSSTMNDRFPFIDTGRRASINSARFSRSSCSATDSGSSPRSKGTPASKVYCSKLSIPATVNWAPQHTPKTDLKDSKGSDSNKDKIKENVVLSTTPTQRPESAQSSTMFQPPLTTKENKLNSRLPISSVQLNRSTPPLTQCTTTIENVSPFPSTATKPVQRSILTNSPQRQRMRINMLPLSPSKLTMRPKSAFELRGKAALFLTTSNVNAQVGPVNKSPKEKIDQFATRTPDPPRVLPSRHSSGIDQETLCMLLESPWAISGPLPLSRSSIELTDRVRAKPKVHVKHSSSTLALHREPSPGLEEQTIDAIIDERPLSRRSNFSSICGDERGSVTGRITPGQRMAERFLRERSAPRGSGAGTPYSEVEQETVRTGLAGQKLEREDTPAFL